MSAVEQRVDRIADMGEALAHGLAVHIAVVDAFEDRGELERGQPKVETERGQVARATRGVAVDDLGLGQEARSGGDADDLGAAATSPSRP